MFWVDLLGAYHPSKFEGGFLGTFLALFSNEPKYFTSDMVIGSVADPYHFETDPDPGCEKIRYGSGSRVNFDTDPDPGKKDTDLDPAKKD